MRAPAQKNLVFPYLVSLVLLTWCLDLPAYLAKLGHLPGSPEAHMHWVALGALAPTLLFLVFARLEGRASFGALRFWPPRSAWPLTWMAPFVSGALLTVSLVLVQLMGLGSFPLLHLPQLKEHWIALFVFSIGEELGWRGYAWSRLRERYSPFWASFYLGTSWALWHFVMMAIQGLSWPLFLSSVPFFVAGSLVFGYFYDRSERSVLIAVLLHMGAHLNNSSRASEASMVPFLAHTTIFVLVALWLLRVSWPRPESARVHSSSL